MLRVKKISIGDFFIYTILALLMFIILYPLLNILAVSFSPYSDVIVNPFMLFPKTIDFSNYKWVFDFALIWKSYINTIIITVCGVFFSMFLTSTYGYALSTSHFKGKGFFSGILLFTMFFNGGLIPNFYLIKSLGMYDTLFALFIPGALSAYNAILMINFFKGIPESLREASKIDGASEFQIFTKVILPLSLPILATLSLFYAVSKWNSFFEAVIYIRNQSKWPLQLLLREILFTSQANFESDPNSNVTVMGMKYAVIVVSVVPILCVYPFVQKYFTKGVMLGSIKE